LLALRWLVGWNFGLLVIFFALLVSPLNSVVENAVKGIGTKTLVKRYPDSIWPRLVVAIITFSLTTVVMGLALWEAIYCFYDVTPSGKAWIASHVYSFWSTGVMNLVLSPPERGWNEDEQQDSAITG
jgi:hypothetical protein